MAELCQQYELYAAETRAAAGCAQVPPADLQRWVDELRELPWWQHNFDQVSRIDCHVRAGDREGSAGGWSPEGSTGVIEMAPVHLNELYVLHEVSHVLAAARYGSRSHDPWFARTYLELVSLVLGPETYLTLRADLDEQGVDFTATGTRGGIEL